MSESTIKLSHRDARWEVVVEWREDLLGNQAPDWFELEREPRATCVKKGFRRAVWRVEWDGRIVFAKVSDLSGGPVRHRIKTWLVGTQAHREWRACRRAASRSVSVIHALGAGVRGGAQARAVLLSEALSDAERIVDLWERDEPPKRPRSRHGARVDLIASIARFFAESHELGFAHQDGHPGNVLVTPAGDGTWRGVFVDVHPVRFTSGPISYHDTLRAVAQFDDHFQRVATRTQRLRFLRCYWASRDSFLQAMVAERSRLTDLAEAKATHADRLARHRDRRLRREGKYFVGLDLGHGWRARVACRLERRHVFPEPCVPDRTKAEWRLILDDLLACGSADATAEATQLRAGLAIERKSLSGLADRFAATVGRSNHQKQFEACHRDRHRDRPAPLILGYAERTSGGLINETWLIRAG